MGSYRVFATTQFQKELDKFCSPYEQRILNRKLETTILPQLKDEPHFGRQIKKLKNYDPETWRYRMGKVRIFYSIDETKKVVILTALRLRKDAYR